MVIIICLMFKKLLSFWSFSDLTTLFNLELLFLYVCFFLRNKVQKNEYDQYSDDPEYVISNLVECLVLLDKSKECLEVSYILIFTFGPRFIHSRLLNFANCWITGTETKYTTWIDQSNKAYNERNVEWFLEYIVRISAGHYGTVQTCNRLPHAGPREL